MEAYKIRQCLKLDGFRHLVWSQLHHFSDASDSDYDTVSHLRMMNQHHLVHCTFLMDKARVAPLKTITIPRKELTAATVAVQAELELPLKPSVFWTDSTSVLKDKE